LAALVFLLAYFLLTLLGLTYSAGPRRALLTAAVAFGLLLVVITESLSAVRLLSFAWLVTVWLLAAVAIFVLLVRAWCAAHADALYEDDEHKEDIRCAFGALLHLNLGVVFTSLPAFYRLFQNALLILAEQLRALAERSWAAVRLRGCELKHRSTEALKHNSADNVTKDAAGQSASSLVPGAWSVRDRGPKTEDSAGLTTKDHGLSTKDLAKRLSLLVLLIGVVAIAAATGIIAFTAPPNNYDSMYSHTAKIPCWVQNHSVAHYATHSMHALRYEPFAGFCNLQFQVLTGGDTFANGVQWFSMIGCLVGVSLIARCLGAQARGQTFAVVLCATLPMGIMQSTSTQVDYVTSFWLVCVVYHLLLLIANPSSWSLTLLLGASLGLALLTKATNYFFAFPFGIWLAWFLIRKLKGRAFLQGFVIAAMALLINAPHYARNISTFGHPLGLSVPSSVKAVTTVTLGARDAIETSLRLDDAHYGSQSMPLLVDDKAPVNYVSFKVSVDEAGLYDLSALFATAASSPFDLYINGYRERENVGAEITGGYYVGNLRRVLVGRIYLIKGENTIKLQRDKGPLPHMAGLIISAPTELNDQAVLGVRLKVEGGLVVNRRGVSSVKTEDRGPRTEDRKLRTEEQIRDPRRWRDLATTEVAPMPPLAALARPAWRVGAGAIRRMQQTMWEPAPSGECSRPMWEPAPSGECSECPRFAARRPLSDSAFGNRLLGVPPAAGYSVFGAETAQTIATLRSLPLYEYQTPQAFIQSLLASVAELGPAAAHAASPDDNGAAENGWVETDDIFGDATDADVDPAQLLNNLGSELGVNRYSEFSLPWMMSAISKNVAMQLATSDTKANEEIWRAVEAIHKTLGIDLNRKSAPDRSKGWRNTFFVRQMLDEDIAVNPDQFMLFIFCLVLMLVSGRVRAVRNLRTITLCIVIGFILLSIWFGWSPYNSRRFLPLFVIASPVIAVTLCTFIRIPYLVELLAASLLWFSYPWVVANRTRPLVGARTIFNTPRYDQYFVKFEQLRTPYKAITAFLQTNKIASVGFYSDKPFVDYPLVMALQADPHSQLRFRHIGVNNPTRNIRPRFDEPDPEIIVSWDPSVTGMQTKATSYAAIWSDGNVAVLAGTPAEGGSKAESKVKGLRFKVAEGRDAEKRVISDSKLQTAAPLEHSPLTLDLPKPRSAFESLAESMRNCFADVDAQMLVNGRFLDGMTNWLYWQYGAAHTNSIIVENNTVRIENPYRQLIGIQQRVAVVSGAVYRLSGVARSVATTQSDIIFGGRVAFYLPPQTERQLVWMSEYNDWSQKELVFTNAVTGNATILVHMGYGNVASTGEFANVRLERVP